MHVKIDLEELVDSGFVVSLPDGKFYDHTNKGELKEASAWQLPKGGFPKIEFDLHLPDSGRPLLNQKVLKELPLTEIEKDVLCSEINVAVTRAFFFHHMSS